MAYPVSFDREELHLEAAAAFDRDGRRVKGLFERQAPYQPLAEPFPTRRQPETVHVLSSSPVSARVDYAGRTTGWSFAEAGSEHVLTGEGYRALRLLVERVRKKPPFDRGFGDRFLEEAIATWCAAGHQGEAPDSLSTCLLDRCSEAFAEHVYVVPLSYVEIETDVALADIRLITVPTAWFERAADNARARHPENPDAGKEHTKLAREFGNLAGVEVRTAGERRYARDRAIALAGEAAAVLRFMSPAAISSTVSSPVQPYGEAHLPQSVLLRVNDNNLVGYDCEWHHAGLAMWKLAAADIDRLARGPLSNLSRFFDGSALSDYAAHIRPAFFGFCRAIGRHDRVERLVGTISALERLLLRDGTEPLQHMVGERLAFLITLAVADRRQAVADYKAAYALRSRAVHHLGSIENEEVADRLFRHAFLGFHQAIRGMSIFTTHAAFLDAIDVVKFGGEFGNAGK